MLTGNIRIVARQSRYLDAFILQRIAIADCITHQRAIDLRYSIQVHDTLHSIARLQ